MSVYHEPDLSYDRRRTAIITIVGLVLAVAVVACLYFVFNPRINAAPLNTSVASIVGSPRAMFGRKVVVAGKVTRVLNGSAFTMIDQNVAAGPEILVISTGPIPPVQARPANPGLMPGDPVSVAGPVRRYAPDERIDGTTYTSADYAPFKGAPVIFAKAVTPPGSSAVVVTPPGASRIPDRPIYTGQASPNDQTVEVQVVRKDPVHLYGHRVQVQNAVVTEVDSDRGFWVKGNSPERLFVVLGPGLDSGPVEWMVVVKPGQIVTVNGVVTHLPDPATLQSDWKMSPESAAALAKEQVYLFADGIYIRNP